MINDPRGHWCLSKWSKGSLVFVKNVVMGFLGVYENGPRGPLASLKSDPRVPWCLLECVNGVPGVLKKW